MKAVEFAYWLQGYFEIEGSSSVLTQAQLSSIKERAEKVQASRDQVELQAKSFVDYVLGAISAVPARRDEQARATVSQNIRQKLNDLFVHAIDPSYSGDQTHFNQTHNNGGHRPPGMRC
jgi:hypothetical protein